MVADKGSVELIKKERGKIYGKNKGKSNEESVGFNEFKWQSFLCFNF